MENCECQQIDILTPDPTLVDVSYPETEVINIEDLPEGSAVWGQIIGNINDQTDLKAQLDEIRDIAEVALVM